jgi:hypothetical protein
MSDLYHAGRCRKRPLGPVEIGQMRIDLNDLTARFDDSYTEDVLGHPGGRPGGPAVTEAVTKALVAVVAEIAMNVFEARRDQLVYPSGVLGPVQIEVLPERRGAKVEHRTPVLADAIDGAPVVARHSAGLQNVISVERAHAFGAVDRHNLAVEFDRIVQSRKGYQSRRLFAAGRIGDVFPQSLNGSKTFCTCGGFAQNFAKLGPGAESHDKQRMQACVNSRLVLAGGPVEKTTGGHCFTIVVTDLPGEQRQEALHVLALLLHVVGITRVHIP